MQTLQSPASVEASASYKRSETYLKTAYGDQARQYRQDDEIEVTTEHHRHLRRTLESLTRSFDHPIRVLDAGCGTGRYFHCVRNAAELVGLDLCPGMLEEARSPVLAHRVTAPKTSLLCANIFEASFPAGSFDLIYSLGMFALGCPFSAEICRKFHDWLAPGGALFFNITDRAGIRWPLLAKRRVRGLVYRLAPQPVKDHLDRRAHNTEPCAVSHSQLTAVMRQTPFGRYRIVSEPCFSPLWRGRHLECLAHKLGSHF